VIARGKDEVISFPSTFNMIDEEMQAKDVLSVLVKLVKLDLRAASCGMKTNSKSRIEL